MIVILSAAKNPRISLLHLHLYSSATARNRHLDRRRRTLPPQWRDPRILQLSLFLLLQVSALSISPPNDRHFDRSGPQSYRGPRSGEICFSTMVPTSHHALAVVSFVVLGEMANSNTLESFAKIARPSGRPASDTALLLIRPRKELRPESGDK